MTSDQAMGTPSTAEQKCFVVGLGGNLGIPLDQMRCGVASLGAHPSCEVVACSSVYRSPPVGPPQPDYLNSAVRLNSSLAPRELLMVLHEIEAAQGRVRDVRWGPRTLDMDILWSEQTYSDPALEIPHPRLRERWWALRPLLDVAPELSAEYAATLSGLGPVPIPVLVL